LLLALDPSVETALGNSIWTSDRLPPLLPEFTAAARAFFDAEARALDFSDPRAVDDINTWVADVTGGRIDRLLEAIPPDAIMYLINAVYFNADWRARFDPSETRSADFFREDGSTTSVQMMSGPVGHRTLSSATATGVELPYGGGAFTAVALLPPAGQGIDEFVATIDALTWKAWMEAFDAASAREDLERAGLTVLLPRLELRWKGGLGPPLRALGMVDAFDEREADLSRLFGERGPFISRVLQNSFVRVDEAGTEAAAGTGVEVGDTSAPQVFAFDRPFLFAIRERLSGTILFLGVIGDPSAS
ncbi:MAG: serpin family protein, partial [Gemmatimonadota bacterium]